MADAKALLERLANLKIIRADERQAILDALPPDTDAPRLADALLGRGAVTSFQADSIRRGKPEELVYGGKFICREFLAEGGMGCIFKARQWSLNRDVALKTISSPQSRSNDAKQRFERELSALVRLKHPGIVTIYDGGTGSGECYLAMEYVEGVTLWHKVDADGPRPWREACDWIAQAAEALGYAHEMKVVHRDIKPNNLMVTHRGIIKLLDLGLVRFLDDDGGGHPPLTQSKSAIGTSDYMAPEQINDAKRADERADIYSLGCTLYFLCAGKSVFADRNGSVAKAIAHCMEPPPKLRDGCPDAPEELEAILQKMLAKRPEDRQQTMAEIIRALRGLSLNPASQSRVVVEVEDAEELAPPTVVPFEGSKASQERSDNGLEMKLVWCPPGTFRMANRVDVRLTRGFWIGKYLVTQGEWRKLMGTNPSWFSPSGGGKDKVKGEETSRFPVETVSWNDAMEFCRRLTEQERAAGRLPAQWSYTLPTEAQWEYAARAETTTEYVFGDELRKTQANFGMFQDRTTEVGSYPANLWGLCDVHGNVWEWCLDEWSPTLPGGDDPFVGKADVSSDGSDRVYRGGGWYLTAGTAGFPTAAGATPRSAATLVSGSCQFLEPSQAKLKGDKSKRV